LKITLANGTKIDVYRTADKKVIFDNGEQQVGLPKASGKVTLGILGLIESSSEIINIEED